MALASRLLQVAKHFRLAHRSRICVVTFFMVVTVCNLAAPSVASAQSSAEVRIQQLIVGIDETGRVGNWVPVRVVANGFSAGQELQLTVTASDAKGDECESLVAKAASDQSGQVEIEGVFLPGRLDGSITVRLIDTAKAELWKSRIVIDSPTVADGVEQSGTEEDPSIRIATRLRLLRHSPLTVLTVGQTAGLPGLIELLDTREVTRGSLVNLQLDTFSDLPTTRRGYDSVDVVVLNSAFDLNVPQTEALQDWILTGGNLVVSSGASIPKLLNSSLGPWLQSLFGLKEELLSSQDLAALQNFVIGANQLQTNRQNVPIARITSNQPSAIVDSIYGPLVSKTTAGAGVITMIAVDLNQKPVSDWLSLPSLYERLLFGGTVTDSNEQAQRGAMISSLGATDLSTQLAIVSDAVPEDQRWSTWQVMLLIVIFLAAIGPLDYFLIVRILKKPRMTWVTFPALVAAFCGITWLNSSSGRAPEVVRAVHLLDVVQTESRQAFRARSWSSLSTVDSRFASVSTETQPAFRSQPVTAVDSPFTWTGRAEDVYGGLYRPGGAGLGQVTSHRSDLPGEGFDSMPLLAEGSQAFLAETFGDTNVDRPAFESKLQMTRAGLLDGSFVHHLNKPIRNWVIAFRGRIYQPTARAEEAVREIQPDAEWSRNSGGVKISEIRDFLRGVRILEKDPSQQNSMENSVQVQTPYNTMSKDPLDILMMVSLYNTAGGEGYVKLHNNYFRRDEFSDSVLLNSAVLIGVIDGPLTELTVDGAVVPATESQTVVRLVLPVMKSVESTGG